MPELLCQIVTCSLHIVQITPTYLGNVHYITTKARPHIEKVISMVEDLREEDFGLEFLVWSFLCRDGSTTIKLEYQFQARKKKEVLVKIANSTFDLAP